MSHVTLEWVMAHEESCHKWNESCHVGMRYGTDSLLSPVTCEMSHGTDSLMSRATYEMSHVTLEWVMAREESCHMWNESCHVGMSYGTDSLLSHITCEMSHGTDILMCHFTMNMKSRDSVMSHVTCETSRITLECVMARMKVSQVKPVVSHQNASWHVWTCPMSNQSCHIGIRHGTYEDVPCQISRVTLECVMALIKSRPLHESFHTTVPYLFSVRVWL